MERKFLLLLAVMMYSLANYSQFIATPNGIVSEDSTNYIVKSYEGKTAEQLYKAVESYIVSTFVSPKNVMSGQEYSMINLSPLYTKAFSHKSVMGLKCYVDIQMTYVFRFKDGKYRLDAPSINSIYGPEGEWSYSELLFKKNGKPKSENRLENFNEWLKTTTYLMLKKIDWIINGNPIKEEEDW